MEIYILNLNKHRQYIDSNKLKLIEKHTSLRLIESGNPKCCPISNWTNMLKLRCRKMQKKTKIRGTTRSFLNSTHVYFNSSNLRTTDLGHQVIVRPRKVDPVYNETNVHDLGDIIICVLPWKYKVIIICFDVCGSQFRSVVFLIVKFRVVDKFA